MIGPETIDDQLRLAVEVDGSAHLDGLRDDDDGFGGPGGPGGRDRSANFGPPAPPKRLRGAKKGGSQQENKPRGPIKERSDGRIYAVDDLDEAAPIDFDDIATSAPKDTDTDDQGDE